MTELKRKDPGEAAVSPTAPPRMLLLLLLVGLREVCVKLRAQDQAVASQSCRLQEQLKEKEDLSDQNLVTWRRKKVGLI